MFSFVELAALDCHDAIERLVASTRLEYCKLCDTEFFSDRSGKLNCCATCYQEIRQVKRYVGGKSLSRDKLANIVTIRARTVR